MARAEALRVLASVVFSDLQSRPHTPREALGGLIPRSLMATFLPVQTAGSLPPPTVDPARYPTLSANFPASSAALCDIGGPSGRAGGNEVAGLELETWNMELGICNQTSASSQAARTAPMKSRLRFCCYMRM